MKLNPAQQDHSLIFITSPCAEGDDPFAPYIDSLFVYQLVSGREAVSAPYAYTFDIVVALENKLNFKVCDDVSSLLGRRSSLIMREGASLGEWGAQRWINGIITSIVPKAIDLRKNCLPAAYNSIYENYTEQVFRVTIEPRFSQACFSRRRLVYAKDSLHNIAKKIYERWVPDAPSSSIKIADSAANLCPCSLIQAIQNDESDYNFFARILSHNGISYIWEQSKMPLSGNATQLDVGHETMLLFALFKDCETHECQVHASNYKRRLRPRQVIGFEGIGDRRELHETIIYECKDLNPDDIVVKKRTIKKPKEIPASLGAAPLYSVPNSYHDSIHQGIVDSRIHAAKAALKKKQIDYIDGMPPMERATLKLALELKDEAKKKAELAAWRKKNKAYLPLTAELALESGYSSYRAALRPLSRDLLEVKIDGIDLYLNDQAHEAEALRCFKLKLYGFGASSEYFINFSCEASFHNEPPPFPQLIDEQKNTDCVYDMQYDSALAHRASARYFAAIVRSDIPPSTSISEQRNLVCISEIGDYKDGGTTLNNDIWAELSFPLADFDSGLIMRPRKGNVVLCVDRGDFSIPVVVSSLFRNNNEASFARLLRKDASEMEDDLEPLIDYNALSLRNRSALADDSATVSTNAALEISRPMATEALSKLKPGFSQIQLVAKDNGVEPITKVVPEADYSCSLAENILYGLIEGKCTQGSNAAHDRASRREAVWTLPHARPHFQGINLFSEKDILQQSSDSQFINAGGRICIAADKGLELRVGRNCIIIDKTGISIETPWGHTKDAGAHGEYSGEDSIKSYTNPSLGSSLKLDSCGINASSFGGIELYSYSCIDIATFLGSSLYLRNLDASLAGLTTTVNSNSLLAAGVNVGFDLALGKMKEWVADASGGAEGCRKVGDSESDTVGYEVAVAGGLNIIDFAATGIDVYDFFAGGGALSSSSAEFSGSGVKIKGKDYATIFANSKQCHSPAGGFLSSLNTAFRGSPVGGALKVLDKLGATDKLAELLSLNSEDSSWLGRREERALEAEENTLSVLNNSLNTTEASIKASETRALENKNSGKVNEAKLAQERKFVQDTQAVLLKELDAISQNNKLTNDEKTAAAQKCNALLIKTTAALQSMA